jgi:hypothetical protein
MFIGGFIAGSLITVGLTVATYILPLDKVIDLCEKDLPRTQQCKLIAVPK